MHCCLQGLISQVLGAWHQHKLVIDNELLKLWSFVSDGSYLAILGQLCHCKELVKREVALKDDAVKQKATIQQLLHLKSQVLICLFFYKQICYSMLDVN